MTMASLEFQCASLQAGFGVGSGLSQKALGFKRTDFRVIHDGSNSGSGGCLEVQAFRKRGSTTADRKRILDENWRKFFADPSQWWDNRPGKEIARYPDFKHKKTNEALWVDHKLNPEWVEAELTGMTAGTLQSSSFAWNKRLDNYVKTGQYARVVEIFQQMQAEGVSPDKFTFIPVVNACARLGDLEKGRDLHALSVQLEYESDVFVSNSLVDMYAKCGSIEDAWEVFRNMSTRDVVSWNAMIMGYVECGRGQKALELSKQMQCEQVKPNTFTFVAILKACTSISALDEGREVHERIIQTGCETNVFVCNSLVNMYAKCGSIKDALMVFNKMPTRNVVSWSAMIQGYVRSGDSVKALELYHQMQHEGVEPNPITFVAVINACASVPALKEGRCVHQEIIERGCASNVFVGNSLIDMYAKCGSIEDAWEVFSNMPTRDVVSWNAIILGYLKCGQVQKALKFTRQMEMECVDPNPFTFVGMLKVCASLGSLEHGKLVHEHISHSDCKSNIFVNNSLIEMYAKCGSMADALKLFNEMPVRNVASWKTMIQGYMKCGQGKQALDLSRKMQWEGVELDPATFIGIFKASASEVEFQNDKTLREDVIQRDKSNVLFGSNSTSMVDVRA